MELHELSPIIDKDGLLEAIKLIHAESYKLCKQSLGYNLTNSGNMGVFCHYDDEFEKLTNIRKELTEPSDNPNQKYYLLREPIVIPAKGDIPEATYTHLYIRKPDPTPYGKYIGDVDFIMELVEYNKLKNSILNREPIKGALIYDRPGWDTIQLSDPQITAVAYVSTKEFAEKVRVKF